MVETTGRRARKRQSARETMASAAGRLFRQDGYESVTMDQIARAADVARGTLYNHFPAKEHLLAAWIHQELAQDLAGFALEAVQEQEFPAGAAVVLELSAQWCAQHRELLAPYIRFCFTNMQSPEASSGGDGLLALYARMIGNSQASGNMRADLDAAHLAELFHHLYLGALMRWLAAPGLSLSREFSTALDVFLRGCSAGAGKKARAR